MAKLHDIPFSIAEQVIKNPPNLLKFLQKKHPEHLHTIIAACITENRWNVLQNLVHKGLDIRSNYRENMVEETWIHYAIRYGLYNNLDEKIHQLVKLGLDPFLANGQAVTPLGLLAINSKNMPNKSFLKALDALEKYNVFVDGLCEWTPKDVQHYEQISGNTIHGVKEGYMHLLEGKDVLGIIDQDPELQAEIKHRLLKRSTPVASKPLKRARL